MSFCSQRTKNLPFFLRNYPSLKRWDCSMFLPRAGWHMRKFTRVYLVFVFWSFHLSAARSCYNWGHHHHLSPKETAVLFQTHTHTHSECHRNGRVIWQVYTCSLSPFENWEKTFFNRVHIDWGYTCLTRLMCPYWALESDFPMEFPHSDEQLTTVVPV